MPVSVVIGGQFGSEGKGKVALELARMRGAVAAIRVGGPNSGHTAIGASGQAHVFRHLPTAALLPDVTCVIAAGAYIDVDIFLSEIASIGLPLARVMVDPDAVLIESKHREEERESLLRERIGSTLSGTGAAVAARVRRGPDVHFAKDEPRLAAFVKPVKSWLRSQLSWSARIIVEGTQGFGLSLLHSEHYPYVTSRDTTAAGFIAEAGLSPLDVDEVALVIRAFPIRVAGASGSLTDEIDWKTLTQESGSRVPLMEKASATGRTRRIGRFDANIVRRALEVNSPTIIWVNHLDYVDATVLDSRELTQRIYSFVNNIEKEINKPINYAGLGPTLSVPFAFSSQRAVLA